MSTPARYVQLTGRDDDPALPIAVEALGDDRWIITVGDERHEVTAYATDRGVALLRGTRSREIPIEQREDGHFIAHLPSGRVDVNLIEERLHRLRSVLGGGGAAASSQLVSPMAGKVVLTAVQPGDEVAPGQTLVIIEAMKMENELRATAAGRVEAVHVSAGETVDPGTLLVSFERDDA